MNSDRESFAPATSWLARAYYTPLTDALRGNLSGSLDIRHQLVASGLPAPVCALIARVVKRARLWRSEQLDVARELLAHFADGRAAGRSAEELIESFGPPEQAARLIRQGKLRSRPLYWQTWWWMTRTLAGLLALGILAYLVLTIRFFWGGPTIARNFWNEINESRTAPEAERAWPMYRQALLGIGKADSTLFGEHWKVPTTDAKWPEVVQALERHTAELALVRQGAALPALGYLIGDPDDRAFAKQHDIQWILSATTPAAESNGTLLFAVLDGIQALRQLTYVVTADTRRAAAVGDANTAMADIVAQLGIAEQSFQPKTLLVEQLVGAAIFQFACDNLGRILHEYPELFSEAQLRDLAHRFSAFRQGNFALELSGEFAMFDDIMQRAYTDDGHGDGRLTAAGIKLLQDVGDSKPADSEELLALLVQAASPGFSAIVGSRRQNTELYRSALGLAQAARTGPPWTWDPDELDAIDRRFEGLGKSPIGKLRYVWVLLMAPAVTHCKAAMQRTIQQRDAVEVALALTLWHRRHNAWPEQLDQLVPDLLPAVPPDRCDGKPLRYAVRDGQPLLYSIGNDGVDDGGVAGSNESAHYGSNDLRNAQGRPRNPLSKPEDWILWPAPAPQEPDPDNMPLESGEPPGAGLEAPAAPAGEYSPESE